MEKNRCMISILAHVICFGLLVFVKVDADEDDDNNWKKRFIVCIYNPDSHYKQRYNPDMIDPTFCTHLNYEFAHLDGDTYRIKPGDYDLDVTKGFYKKATDLRSKSPGLKVYLSLGGWTDSTMKYSRLIGSERNRNIFIPDAISYLKRWQFDGIDIAMEYPNAWQGSIGKNPADKANFVTFLTELRQELDKNSLELSVSVAAYVKEVEAAYDTDAIYDAVDHINVMAYDMHGPWEYLTSHHGQFQRTDTVHSDSNLKFLAENLNFKQALKNWGRCGEQKTKVIAGIPAYGRTFTLVDPSHHDIGVKHIGKGRPGPRTKEAGYLDFSEICDYIIHEKWNVVEDPNAGAYAYNGDQWVGFDSLKDIVRKVKYVIDCGYGGLLLKSVDGDDHSRACYNVTYPALRTIKMELIKREKADRL